MPCHRVEHVPVLIVGAGPAGLMTAVALARHGVDCRLVERRREISTLPRATAISLRSMELLRAWGLDEAVRAGGAEVEWLQWYCETLAQAAGGEGRATGFPSRAQSAVVSPTSPACVPQDHLEPVLLRDLRSLAPDAVAFGTELVSVTHRDDGVRAVLRECDGATRIVEADYLVAADGAHSTVRRELGIAMQGPDDLSEAVTVLFRAPLWQLVGDRRYGLYAITHPEADGVFLPGGQGDRWLYGVMCAPGGPPARDVTEAALARRIRLGSGVAGLRPRIERIGTFRFAAQLAERFALGRAFLVGDAAHRATPRGGTGMNTALHDGYDLGWKLAWVLRGWADPPLLDLYEAERRPVAEHNVTRSADPDGTARAAEHELHTDLGGRIVHTWVPSAGDRVSTLDLLGPGLTLFTGPRHERWRAAAAPLSAGPPVTVASLDAITARAIGVRTGGALLVRPDGAPASSFRHDDPDPGTALRAAVRSATGHTTPDRAALLRTALAA